MFIRLLLSMAMIFAALASWALALADEEVEQKKHNREEVD